MKTRIVISYNNFDKIAMVFSRETGRVVRKTANLVKSGAIASMKGIKKGRVYKRGKVKHVASAPGEPPAVDTGNLKNSIFVENTSKTSAIVGVGAEYGIYLEYGTHAMEARPFMRYAASKAERSYHLAMTQLEKRLQNV